MKLAYDRLAQANLRLGPHKRQVQPGEEASFEPRIKPNARWGLLIGDCVQNLRAALDHAVFQVVPGNVRATSGDDISFPIFDDSASYNTWKAKRKRAIWIAAVQGKAMKVIDSYQPSDGGNPQPRKHPLWMLYRLSNIDKHRAIHITMLGIKSITVPEGFSVTPEPQTHRLIVSPPASASQEPMNMRLNMTLQILFAEGEDIAGSPVFGTLVDIGADVAGALNRLRDYMV